MKVRELIQWLQEQDQEAIINIVDHRTGTGYYEQGGTASESEFKGGDTQFFYSSAWKFKGINYPAELLLGQIDG